MPEIDIFGVKEILKQRYPFLMVDRITDYDDMTVTGYKNVTINEPFFNGHFPDDPVMPGVMILESMGQVTSVLLGIKLGKEQKNKIAFLTGIDKARFRKPVRPGDKLVTKAELTNVRSTSAKAKAKAYVDGEVVAEAEFLTIVADTLDKNQEAAN
ncbi:MAG: 3-hydroxyacyl-ACP dehydratase FabZ [Synergistaceae bacterium]|nr:3-hydroxyacyl-ACP dehydratase FabZ [Synergistaceae bacterium]MBQ6112620.1 3-hydroxyacyl-ACP dehydratase FabZ [Synergistaceae bacterium]MBQ9628998.1 3-hydroxyacyl-ACP dehydratase FabZ [Synergistaceae bacterium]MBR0250552.1 3-hydroxyacyl-ACP dehydratase FabZ [Synergistaceae bacterium]